MLPAINRSAGMNIGFPDVCLTPAGVAVVPVPYPNMGMHAMSVGFSVNVMLTGTPALNLASMIPITTGDEAGVAHPMIKQMGKFMTGNPIVHVNLLPGITLTCLATGNNMNNALGAVLAPGITNVFYTYRGGGEEPGEPEEEGSPPAGGESAALAEIAAIARELASVGRENGPPVDHAVVAPGVGYILIRVFSADVPARVSGALRALSGAGVEVLVLDLRDNPGGEMFSFVELARDFLPDGSEICTLVDAEGDETPYLAGPGDGCSIPLVILVNGATASAAELFADCLSAHGRALVLGGPTYGKRAAYRFAAGAGGEVARVSDVTVRIPTATRGSRSGADAQTS